LESVRRVLQTDATFILEFANKHNLKAILRYAFGKQSWSPFTPEPVEFAVLNFDFQPASVRAWLEQVGFRVERQLTVSHYRAGIFKKIFPLKLLVGMDSLASLTGDWWQLSPSVFVLTHAIEKPGLALASNGFFACPACAAALEDTPPQITCPACGQNYPIQDGIYDFRLNAGQ
jgi:hypothetical protein